MPLSKDMGVSLNKLTVGELKKEAKAAESSADFTKAEMLYRIIAQREPKNVEVRQYYIDVLLKQYKYALAKKVLDSLIKKNKSDPSYLYLRLRLSTLTDDKRQATIDSKKLLQINPNSARLRQNIATSYRNLGMFDEAIDLFHSALKLNKNQGESYRHIRQLQKNKAVTSFDLQIASDLASGIRDDPDFYFGLGKLYDDLEDYEAAWEYYAKGNAEIHRSCCSKNVPCAITTGKALKADISRYIEQHGTAPREAHANVLLIAGYPRSGTTMLEHVIASDDHFQGCEELALSGNALTALRSKRPEGSMLEESDIEQFGDYYASGLNQLNLGKKIAVDKSVALFRSGGLFMLAFSNIKMIHMVRDPLDVIISNFKERFLSKESFWFSIPETIAHLEHYYETISYWHEQFPDRVLLLNYDRYVRESESYNQILSTWLGGDQSEYSFNFSGKKHSVKTATATQIGDKIRTSSSGKAEVYKPFLEEWEEQIASLYGAMP